MAKTKPAKLTKAQAALLAAIPEHTYAFIQGSTRRAAERLESLGLVKGELMMSRRDHKKGKTTFERAYMLTGKGSAVVAAMSCLD